METTKKMKDWAECLCSEVEKDHPNDSPLNRGSFLLFWDTYHHKAAKLIISNTEDLEVKESLARQIFKAWFENRSVMSVIKARNKVGIRKNRKSSFRN